MRTACGLAAVALLASAGCISTEDTTSTAEQPTGAQAPATEDAPLTQAAVLIPIAAGELENWQSALAELIGPDYDDYQASRSRFGLEQQTTVLQETPMGNFALIYMEGPDLDNTSRLMATSPEEWDVGWREMTSGLHGSDFSDPDALAFDVHLVLDTGNIDDEAKSATTPFNFFIPLDPTNTTDFRSELETVMAERGDEYRAARASIGVAEEKVFLQNTIVGPGLVVYWEADDPKASLDALLNSSDPFDVWFQEQFAELHALPTESIAPIWADNVLVADFPARS